MTQDRPSILILGTADWNQPIATNQHYITRELARLEVDITFVESLALRRPRFKRRDISRIFSRLLTSFRGGGSKSARQQRSQPPNVSIVSPIVIPIHKGVAAAVNEHLLRRFVTKWLEAEGPKVLWCYTPTTYGLESVADATVYHCVDLLGEVPGIDPNVIRTNEVRLARGQVRAIATSEAVERHLRTRGFRDVELWENVADTAIFSAAGPEASDRMPGRVVFAGNLAQSKVDYSLLEKLALAGLDVQVAGPLAEGGADEGQPFARLLQAGVTYLGMLTLEELAQAFSQATVGLIPYAINAYTLGVSPLKTYEYLSSGLAVVATALPGVHPDDVDVFAEHDEDAFVARVAALAHLIDAEAVKRRIDKSVAHSWDGRGREARAVLDLLIRETSS